MPLRVENREIAWSISVPEPGLPADLSDAYLEHLLDAGMAQPLETYPKERDIALPAIEWPVEQESVASAVWRRFKSKGFWPVVVVSFAGILSVVTLLIARLR